MAGYPRSLLGQVYDVVGFPVRALFMGPRGFWGLTSLREERMSRVAQFCRGRVLDIGCGPGDRFITEYIGRDRGVGVDVFPYEGVDHVITDAAHLPFPDASFDTVTLVAVGGHIPRRSRAQEFVEFSRVLRSGGRLVMTEGEPVTQYLHHKWQALYLGLQGKVDMDTERGMDDDEEYCMPKRELLGYLNTPPLRHVLTQPFQWHLNFVYVAEKAA